MHFSHAFVAVLSVVGTHAAALPVANGVAGSSNGLIARGAGSSVADNALNALTARGLAPEVASESRNVFARYADMADEHQRSILIARDLSKRGILDMLVQAISNLLTELLGTNPQKRDSTSAKDALQQLTGLSFSNKTVARQSFAQMLDMLGKALEQQATLIQQASNSTSANATASATGKTNHSSGSSNSTSTALPSVSSDANANATVSANAQKITTAKEMVRQGNKSMTSKRSVDVQLAERQEGVQGLLEVLRQLVDAILNTLLPMNSRSTSSNATSAYDTDCPAPGTPNDGMYRPGCPGYGRRAVTDTLLKVRDAAASSDQLAQLLPLLQQLTQQLPQLSGADAGVTDTTPDATATGAVAGTPDASAAPTAAAAGATDASATATDASATATDATTTAATAAADGVAGAAASAAQQSLTARDLLEADGFELARRQQQSSLVSSIIELVQMVMQALASENSSGGNSTDTSSSKKKSSSSSDSPSLLASLLSSSMSKRDGIDLSILNNLLGNLLSGAGSTQSSDNANDKRDGIDLSILNNLLGNLLSGAGSTQSSGNDKRDGINLSFLNNLLGNLLSGAGSTQSSDNANDKRDGIDLSILNNLLGNLLSGAGSTQSSGNYKRDGLNLSVLNNLLGNLLSGAGSTQSSDNAAATKRSGIDLSILDNLLGNLLGGDNSTQIAGNKNSTDDGGINISALNNLLGNLLSGLGSSQNARRSFIELTARADFKPVWDEIKKVGNQHFHLERRAASGGLSDVWSSFRDMVDQGYKQGLERRSPSPKVDTSAFSHAAAQYLKNTLFASSSHHDRRSLEQLKPLADAASTFAKQQMKEWTEALNEHTAKHTKSH